MNKIQRIILQKRFNVIRIALFRSKEEKEKTQNKEKENKDVGVNDKMFTEIEDLDAKSSVAEFSNHASMYTFPNFSVKSCTMCRKISVKTTCMYLKYVSKQIIMNVVFRKYF